MGKKHLNLKISGVLGGLMSLELTSSINEDGYYVRVDGFGISLWS